MNLSVIIPVYNEVQNIREILRRVQATGLAWEIVIIDDGSTDGTREILKELDGTDQIRVILHEKNQGKGAAVRTGFGEAKGDVFLIQDADLEYDPRDYPAILKPLEEGLADVVYGSRYSGTEILVDSFWHYFGNRLLTAFSNVLSNVHLTDMETCYKMMRSAIFKDLLLECRRFGIEPELTAKLARRKCRIYEVPISYKARRFDEGKKIGWRDAIAACWYVVKYNLLQ